MAKTEDADNAKAEAKKAANAAKKNAPRNEAPKAEVAKSAPQKRGEPNRVKLHYAKTVVPAMTKEFGYTSPMQAPRLTKIVLNSGVGEATTNIKAIDYVVYAMTQIAGQKPIVNRSKKAIAVYKLREGLPIGVSVTLRSDKMWDFLDRLIAIALPRVRDFRGIPTKGFDGRGNYTMGIREQIVFPEVSVEKLDKIRGFDITFVTTARTDAEGRSLLEHLGLPFRKADKKEGDGSTQGMGQAAA